MLLRRRWMAVVRWVLTTSRASLRVPQSIPQGAPSGPCGQTLTEYIWNWVVRLRFAAELIAIRLQGPVTNSHGARSSQPCAASKRTGTLPRGIGRGSHSHSANITLNERSGGETASG